ncbi:MAG: B12-binding domain-containing radical SAM protein, partial [Deltaproteobacteria bacterium]|nr:B12-binding domain-containing radical SAM protein [Deltaproteobacteria bacterium]
MKEEQDRQPGLVGSLTRRLEGFDFEEGALLVQVPQVPLNLLEREVACQRGYFAYPPQGALYLAAVFRKLNLPATVVDLNFVVLKEAQKEGGQVEAAWQRALDEALEQYERPFLGLSFMFEMTYPDFVKVCRHLRARRPGACLAAGGVAATADPDRLLKEGVVDLVFSHQGDTSLEGFYAYLRGQREEAPPNLSFLDAQGEVIQTEMVKDGEINQDIRAEYDLIPIADYQRVGSLSNYSRMNGIDVPFATLLSRRGCRGRCTFCGVRGFAGRGVKVRDNENLLAEMEHLYHCYGIKHFDWLDDDPLFKAETALDLFQQMAKRLPGVTWAYNNGLVASSVTAELMEAMRISGCIGFKVGLESGNLEMLKKIRKPITIKKFFDFAQMAAGFPEIFIGVNFILGLPGETLGQMLDSLKVALAAKL